MANATARFTSYVSVTDDDGAFHSFSPGTPVPDWARSRVGDHVISTGEFDGDEQLPDAVNALRPPEPEPERDPDLFDTPRMPPISGPGSGQPEWVRYARSVHEDQVTGTWSRQDIIDLLIRRGHITDDR